MSLFCWTQRKIFWRMWETEQFWGTIDLHSIFFPTMEVNGAPKQPGYKLSSKISTFVFDRTKTFTQVWNYRIFIFGWTIPLTGHQQWSEEKGIQVKSSLLYCQFIHMYSTYIQRIEIALLSDPWCILLTLNTDSRRSNTDKYSLNICTYKLYRYTNEDIVEKEKKR